MSSTSAEPLLKSPIRDTAPGIVGSRWIISPAWDQLLFVSTPLFILPVVICLHSIWRSIDLEALATAATAIGALGHHLPGMLRAYGDRELFQRFQMRFTLAPVVLFTIFFPLYLQQRNVMQLMIGFWACWHGLMQVYGFVRIYDAKTGSVSNVTAFWDWLMCLVWFYVALFLSPGKMSGFLENWYAIGGPMIPPIAIQWLRPILIVAAFAVLIGFAVNYVLQYVTGPKPNPAKLLALAMGIGCWWFSMVFVHNIILGIALFEIFHDVQYLAIVWLYSCRRANSASGSGEFTKYLFRRQMLLFYVAIILAYGAIGLIPGRIKDGTFTLVITDILWTSTILHYYFDGFIWKVREKSTRVSLGLAETKGSLSNVSQQRLTGFVHFTKWVPVAVAIFAIFLINPSGSPLSSSRKEELSKKFTLHLLPAAALPKNADERNWVQSLCINLNNIASAVPVDVTSQKRAAIISANLGYKEEAISLLKQAQARNVFNPECYLALGEIYQQVGKLAEAFHAYEAALSNASRPRDRTIAHYKLGEILTLQGKTQFAREKFLDALREQPDFEPAQRALDGKEGESS